MKLLHETPENYIAYCRKELSDQQWVLKQFKKLQSGNPNVNYQEVIEMNEQLLNSYQERYDNATRGIYE